MKILFVCTGNTCRSPMASALCRKLATAQGRTDILCQSAGLSARTGDLPAANAVTVCRELDVDVSTHRARRLTADELSVWDVFFVMTATHGYILQQAGVPTEKIYVAQPEIPDPYGGDVGQYRACRDALLQAIGTFLESCPVQTEPSCRE